MMVMTQNFDLFGVRRAGGLLRWENIVAHHVLRFGRAQGYLDKVSNSMYRIVDLKGILGMLAQEMGAEFVPWTSPTISSPVLGKANRGRLAEYNA